MSRAARRPVPFWLRPKWVVGHILVVVLVVTFVFLGFWQLDRLQDRRARNADISARAEVPVQPIGDVVTAGVGLDDAEELQYRRVSLTGTYDEDGQVLIRPRSLDGVSGWHVVTPVVLDDGRAVLVTRGFAPLSTDLDVVRQAVAPPEGEVTVTGLLLPTQERQGIGPTDPEDGVLAELSRVDIARIGEQYDRALLPVHVQLATQEPPQADLPQLIPTPLTDEGPHLSYAVQWFLFAGVGLVGWPILLHRTGREERDGRGPGGGGQAAADHPRQPIGASAR